MLPQKYTTTEGEYSPRNGMQGPSRRLLPSHAYPEPASLGTHTFPTFNPNHGCHQPAPVDAKAIEPNNHPLPDSVRNNMSLAEPHHGLVNCSQSQATFLVSNTWGGHGISPYAANMPNDSITLDPSLRGNDFWNRQGLEFNQQILQAASWGNQFIGSSFRGTNMPAQGTNRVTEDFSNSSKFPLDSSSQYIPLTKTNEVEEGLKHGKRRLRAPGSDAHRQKDLDQSTPQDPRSANKKRRSTLPSSAAPIPPAGEPGTLSILGQKKARFGDMMGDDHKPKAEIKRENGVLYGWVDNEWRSAGYHRNFREKLIMMDAQQPGAPVFSKGMSTNYTSYSPLTLDWTEDPHSIKDSKGRELMFMPARPQDLTHNPICGHLMCEGLVMLDHNNRPIKAYPGAPRTLAVGTIEPQAFFLEGLRRVFGMTIWDIRARMPGEYNTKFGMRPLQGPSVFTNRPIAWRKLLKSNTTENPLCPWHIRRPPKAATMMDTNPSSAPNEGELTERCVAEGLEYLDYPPNFAPESSYPPQNFDEFGSDSHASSFPLGYAPLKTPEDLGMESVKWDDFDD